MALSSLSLFALLWCFAQVLALQTLWPPDVPLAVRSPYFNAYMPTAQLWPDKAPSAWPQLATRNRDLGWSGYVRVDGQTFQWLGARGPGNAVISTGLAVTPTRTIFTVQAGPMELNVTFFSPIEPADISRQSFPFAYMYVDARSTDGNQHEVQLYTDICGQWLDDTNDGKVQWNTTQTGSLVYHQMFLQNPVVLRESNDQASDGTLYYASPKRPGLTWQTGSDVDLRGSFNKSGPLLDAEDLNFRALGNNFPVMAFSTDLGTIFSTNQSIVWAVGVVRDPAIQYLDRNSNPEFRSSYFWTNFATIQDAIEDFLQDFPQALQRADNLDHKILTVASTISPDYFDLVSLVTPGVFGGAEITVPRASNGSLNASDIKIFFKDLGFSQRMNAVESLYAALPAMLFLNCSLTSFMLEPLLDYQLHQNIPFAVSDLGSTFPIATAVLPSSQFRGIEDTGSMLIMTLAHAMYSGDGSLISRYYPLLRKWATYLVSHVFDATGQGTADVPTTGGQNNVNLAIKGIIGIQAMSLMSQVMGESQDAQDFGSHALDLFNQWRNQSFINGRLLMTYGDISSGGLIYNLYAHRLLKMNLIDDSIFAGQDSFYQDQMLAVSNTGRVGLPLSNATGYSTGRLDWTMFTAGAVNDSSLRDSMIAMVHSQANVNISRFNFSTEFDITTGGAGRGKSSPSQGSIFSLLALTLRNQTIIVPSSNQQSSPSPLPSALQHRSHALSNKVIVGIAVALAGVIALFALGIFWWRRRRQMAHSYMTPQPTPFGAVEQPFDHERMVFSSKMPSQLTSPITQSGQSTSPVNVTAAPVSLTASTYSTAPEATGTAFRQTQLLRSDVQELRREMERMRMAVEAPPQYLPN